MKAKQFGIEKRQKRRIKWEVMHSVFAVLLFLSFCFFAMYAGVSKLVFSNKKIDLFTKELSEVSSYLMPVDTLLAQKILILDQVLQAYLGGENVLANKTDQIDDLRKYAIDNKDYLAKVGFKNYLPVMEFLSELYTYKDEVYQLLGKDQPFHYLVLLQNGNEKRPNG